jgi:hypothetical protein
MMIRHFGNPIHTEPKQTRTDVAFTANPLMKLMIRSSIKVDSPGIQETGTYKGISFTGKNAATLEMATTTAMVSGQTEWLLLSMCKTPESWQLTHALLLNISFR